MATVKDSGIVVPSGEAWNELQKIFPLLQRCRVVPAGSDPPGFFMNEQKTEMVLKLPIADPSTTGVDPARLTTLDLQVCLTGGGTQVVRFVIMP